MTAALAGEVSASWGHRVRAFSQSHTLMQSGNYRLDAKIIKFNYLASVMQEARKDNIPALPLINDVHVCKAPSGVGLFQFQGPAARRYFWEVQHLPLSLQKLGLKLDVHF